MSLSPAAPVSMAGPSSSTIQGQLDKLNELSFAELCKGDNRSEGLVAQLQRERELLLAQIDRQTLGEVQHHGSVLCCQAPLTSG